LLAAYADEDGSGDWTEGEAVTGTSADVLFYLDTDGGSGNVLDTWVLMTVDFVGGTEPVAGEISSGADMLLFATRETYSFGGTYDLGTLPPGTLATTLSPLEIATDSALPDRPLDTEVTGDLSFTLDGPLPETRHFDVDNGTKIGLEFPALYQDDTEPAGPNTDDNWVAWACLHGDTVGFAWLPKFQTIAMGLLAMGTDLRPGWNAIYTSRDWENISQADASALNFSASACEFADMD